MGTLGHGESLPMAGEQKDLYGPSKPGHSGLPWVTFLLSGNTVFLSSFAPCLSQLESLFSHPTIASFSFSSREHFADFPEPFRLPAWFCYCFSSSDCRYYFPHLLL